MKPGITGKLVAVMLTSSILLVAAMAIATHFSFQKGFLDYLSEAELGRLDNMVEELANAYRREGDWGFIRTHQSWAQFLPHNQQGAPIIPSASPPLDQRPLQPRASGQPPRTFGRPVPPPAPRDHSGLSTRLRLMDTNRLVVIGPPDTSGNPMFRAIKLDDDIVGWLSLTPLPVPTSGIDQQFRDQQLDAIYPIALGALFLALLIGIPLGRHLLLPVKTVTKGARALAQGHYETRLQVHSQDELGQLAHDFNALAQALERNELLRRQGMADISHELRTPLALFRGEIEAMQDGIRPIDKDQLNSLHASTMQLNRLVDDLYDLALSDAGALNYQKEQINLAELLRSAALSAEPGIRQQGLSLEVSMDDELIMQGDPRRLRQVIDNLLKNSRRYTDPGGKITLSAWTQSGYIHIQVEDSTPGADELTLPRLFERFYRAEGSRNRASGGAGLGLSICKNITEAHQGSISAEPSPLGGLMIVVSLPNNR